MTARHRSAIGGRPPANPRAEAWIRQGDGAEVLKGDLFTARMTLDVTPGLRARIKVEAFSRGTTVAEMLRALLQQEYGEESS